MKLLKICKNRMEAEALIHDLKEIGVVPLIKAVPVTGAGHETELHLLVDDKELTKSQEHLKFAL